LNSTDGGWLQIGDAMQNNANEPFDLLLSAPHPRIIVSPTYRLNVFGFLCSPTDMNSPSPSLSPCPGNFGLWDQRLALQWTHQNISLFSGNPSNITLGGLSAGAYSAMFQLHHDTYHAPPSPSHTTQPLIRRAYLWSNAVGIQPNPSSSSAISTQFSELTTHFAIPASLRTSEKLSILRALPWQALVCAIPSLKSHTFRAVTDDDFIPSSFLTSIYHPTRADFSQRLKRNGVKILLGEVRDEARLYRLVNAPSDREGLGRELRNYYPGRVVDALIGHYGLPSSSDDKEAKREDEEREREAYRDLFARIAADAQIYAPIRGLTHALLSHPSGLTPTDIFRYRIFHLPRSLSSHLDPRMGICHGADASIWWMSGVRAGFTDHDKRNAEVFLEPFGRFVYGEGDGDGSGDGDGEGCEGRGAREGWAFGGVC
jgi:carboxylesterase type B